MYIANKMQKIALIGGGQLGKMIIQAGLDWDIEFDVLDGDAAAPCKNICSSFTQGSLSDEATVWAFVQGKQLVTYEIEHINTAALARAEASGVAVYPSSAILAIVQNKVLQKQFFVKHRLPTSDFEIISGNADIILSSLQFPVFYKLATGGYDGRGVKKINAKEFADAGFDKPGILEQAADIEKELAIMVARSTTGEIKTFPVVEMVFDPVSNMVDYLISPAQISPDIEKEAAKLAILLAQELNLIGVLAVEMFYTKQGDLLINEIAPRPHNSMHHSIEGNATSQFQQHLRAIMGLPLGDTSIRFPYTAMLNLVGDPGYIGKAHYKGIKHVLKMPNTWVHLYGKAETRPYRKMGHITLAANHIDEIKAGIAEIKKSVQVISQ
jgi:5-(carboxyamino)imidazole ribonucleotide synthase